jgi:hypothetical protein
VKHSLLVELSAQEALTLIRIANVDVVADDVGEALVTRLLSLGLVEQRGASFGLTLMGIQSVARLRRTFAVHGLGKARVSLTA